MRPLLMVVVVRVTCLWACWMSTALSTIALPNQRRQQQQSSTNQEQQQQQQQKQQRGQTNNPNRPNHRVLDFLPGHLQSGPDAQGNSFASAGMVDDDTQTLHIVGTTYGDWWSDSDSASEKAASGTNDPACFYAVANLPGGDNDLHMDWIHFEMLGTNGVQEGCTGLLVDVANLRTIVIGSSDVYNPNTNQVDGLLGPTFFQPGNIQAEDLVKAGMILDYTFTGTDGPTAEHTLQLYGGYWNQVAAVNYPVAVTGRLPGPDVIYTVTMHSDSAQTSEQWDNGKQMDPAKYFPLGKSFYMTIDRYNTDGDNEIKTLHRSIIAAGRESFDTDGREDVRVATMIQLPDRLLVAGFTKGVGNGFGSAALADEVVTSSSFDGFVTQFNLTDMQPLSTSSFVPTHRITSGGRDDFVTGLCWSEAIPEAFFVTGSSFGHIHDPSLNKETDSGHLWAFVRKVRLADMKEVWTQEFGTSAREGDDNFQAEAISCVVTQDGESVFVAGNVHFGASMYVDNEEALPGPDEYATSIGGADVWIAQLQTRGINDDTQPDVVFLRQLGSTQDDFVAQRGGVQVDKNGNAVLIGNTHGQVYRERSSDEVGTADGNTNTSNADVFIAMFERNTGEFTHPLDYAGFISLPPVATRAPAPAATPPTLAPIRAPTVAPARAPTPGASSIDGDESASGGDSEDDSGRGGKGMLVFLLLSVFLVIIGIIYWNSCYIPKRDISTDRSRVLDYLHDFDVEDVELKHSATGGWHCSYTNDLARGINRQDRHLEHHSATDGLYSHGAASSNSGVYDPLTAGTGGGARRFKEEYTAEDVAAAAAEDFVVTFGTARESRRERRSTYDGLLASLGRDPSTRKGGSRRTSNSSVASSNSSGSGSSRRINRARERWENREII